MLFKPPTKVAVLGPAYSEPTKCSAAALSLYGVVQVSNFS